MARRAIHPGEHLSEQLEAAGMSAAELARRLRMPRKRISEIVEGRDAITVDVARRLGRVFHTNPEFWVKLQVIYDRRLGKGRLSS